MILASPVDLLYERLGALAPGLKLMVTEEHREGSYYADGAPARRPQSHTNIRALVPETLEVRAHVRFRFDSGGFAYWIYRVRPDATERLNDLEHNPLPKESFGTYARYNTVADMAALFELWQAALA